MCLYDHQAFQELQKRLTSHKILNHSLNLQTNAIHLHNIGEYPIQLRVRAKNALF